MYRNFNLVTSNKDNYDYDGDDGDDDDEDDYAVDGENDNVCDDDDTYRWC